MQQSMKLRRLRLRRCKSERPVSSGNNGSSIMGDRKSQTRRHLLGAGLTTGVGLCVLPGVAVAEKWFTADRLAHGRITVPVAVNDQPLEFAVDSAANCSVIASDLLNRLGLSPSHRVGMHTLVGREEVDAVRASVKSGALQAENVQFAIGDRTAMMGLDGLLGSDLLVGHRLVLNFAGRARARISMSRSSQRGMLDPVDPSTRLVAAAHQRFESLLMIEARVGSTPAVAIIDSGAGGTIINRAAARAGRATPVLLDDGTNRSRVQTPTGRSASADVMLLPAMGFAGVSISSLPVLVGDFHTFDLWGVADRPAILLGMDVLSLFRSVAIDLRRGEFSLAV